MTDLQDPHKKDSPFHAAIFAALHRVLAEL
jgi:hypothetical protein